MNKHMVREIEKLKKTLLNLSGMVQNSVHKAVSSIERSDSILAKRIIDGDVEINHVELDVEEECLKLLALHQPVAHDLRYVVAVLKINLYLERIADLSVNMAERSICLAELPKPDMPPFEFAEMSETVQIMLEKTLTALLNLDTAPAYEVREMDNIIDNINRGTYKQIKSGMKKFPDMIDSLIHYLMISRSLERIGDHITSVAENIIYMIDGDIVRHKMEIRKQTS